MCGALRLKKIYILHRIHTEYENAQRSEKCRKNEDMIFSCIIHTFGMQQKTQLYLDLYLKITHFLSVSDDFHAPTLTSIETKFR